MSTPSENTYGNLQMEERYKKLERTLKILMMQQKKSCENPSEPTWPSVSSIAGDPLDTSCPGFSSQSSQLGSDVLASSRDMQKMIQNRSNPLKLPQGMTTSSVKRFSANFQQEKALMPPPKSIGILAHSSRRNSLARSHSKIPLQGLGMEHGSAQSVISSIKCSSSEKDISRIEFEKENCRDRPDVEVKPDRIFSKWRPVLNDKGQLIIKGTLECGKIARSKPVIRRLTSVSVQSVFNHIYHLRGNIFDERRELPEFIRGKFYNGFPDDWENVYQVWSNFVVGGCNENFRWPTPITDSDDDLKSEITDVTDFRKARKRLASTRATGDPEDNIQRSPKKSFSMKNRMDKRPEEILRESNQLSPRRQLNSNRQDRSLEGIQENKIPFTTRRGLDFSRGPPGGLADIRNPPIQDEHNKSCCCSKVSNSKGYLEEPNDTIENFMEKIRSQQMNSSAVSVTPSFGRLSMTSLRDIIHEDKLKIILENLTSRKCSITYIDKMIEMFDCLKYVVSYQPDDGIDPLGQQPPETCIRRETVVQPQTTPNIQKSMPPQDVQETHHQKRNSFLRRKLSREDYDSSDGGEVSVENDRRLKVPLKHQEKPLDQLRSTEKRRHPESTAIQNEDEIAPMNKFSCPQPSSKGSESKSQRKTWKVPQQPLVNYDSCVSLTEDERRPSKSHRFLRPREHTPLKTRGLQPANYDSSVSFTEDEFGDDFQRAEVKRQILQEANAKVLKSPDGCIKQCFLEANHRNSRTIPEKKKEEVRQEEPGENKENQMTPGPSRDDEDASQKVNEEIDRISLERTSPEKKKKKPTVVNVEKVNIILPQAPVRSVSEGSIKETSKDNALKVTSGEVEEKNLRVELEEKKSRKSRESTKKGEFGTDSNPKPLTAWVPKLLKRPGSNYGLIFEGKLLNEAGHIASRRFSTDFVVKRVSPQVIETEGHEFYQLIGELSDTKHTVPKEIQKMCLKGCPSRINQFCEKWRKLVEETSPEKENDHNTSIDMIGVPTSSRGRRILPPLCYWTGERITLKDETPVYSAGNTQESSIPSSMEMSFRKDVSQDSSRRRETSAKDTTVSPVLNNTNTRKSARKEEIQGLSRSVDRMAKGKKSPGALEHVKTLRSTSKRRLARDLERDSSDAEEVERETRTKRRKSRKAEGTSPLKEKEEPRKNRDNARSNRPENKGTNSGLTCTYRINVPFRDDVLSDDQLSTM
uniref:SANTA domain-containing protein n=1 Tax=Fopius arisanus TaxID=64838 RepID=A0A0C9RCP5_9HYME